MRSLCLVLVAVCLVGGTGCGESKPDEAPFTVGVVEDAAKWALDPGSELKATRNAGFRAVVLSAVWERDGLSAEELVPPLRRAVDAATANEVAPVVAVYQLSGSTPLTPVDRASFVRFAVTLAHRLPEVRTFIVGNEPNLNLFWMPQFTPDGRDAAAPAYLRLLAETYDALKDEDDDLTIVGGGLASRGSDDPQAKRATQSPTAFIRALGHAYRASGRDEPVMDAFSLHVYGESPLVPPTMRHPHSTSLGIADYPQLVRLLAEAFDGTGQAGSDLPIVYGEYGVETFIPLWKRPWYSGSEVVEPVNEETQARYYRTAIRLAACQRTVTAIYLFHLVDERPMTGLQSGLFYADNTSKSSLGPVSRAAKAATCGKVTG